MFRVEGLGVSESRCRVDGLGFRVWDSRLSDGDWRAAEVMGRLEDATVRLKTPAAQPRRVGCSLDTDGGLNSTYVMRGLSGELAEELGTSTQLLINYDSSRAHPVGGFVY